MAESKIASVFLNTHKAIPMKNISEELNRMHPDTSIQVDNAIAVGLIHKQTRQR